MSLNTPRHTWTLSLPSSYTRGSLSALDGKCWKEVTLLQKSYLVASWLGLRCPLLR